MKLSRRVRTLVVSGVLFLVLFVVALTMPVPYVVLSPGPTRDVLGVDDGGKPVVTFTPALSGTSKSSVGHLSLTTVNVTGGRVSAVEALVGWLKGDEVVVPRSAVIPPGVSEDQVDQQNSADFATSQDSAIVAATCELYPTAFGITGVVGKGPSDGLLEAGDAIVSLDGQPAKTSAELQDLLRQKPAGSKVTVLIARAAKQVSVAVTLGPPPAQRSGGTLGVKVGTVCPAPFQVKLGFGGSIGGPSAGLMFALGIVEKVTFDRTGGNTDLTGGMSIAGTGEIDAAGVVGPIGGIALKMIAARQAGATVFLAPAGNCSDVLGNIPKGLQVVKVATLHEAISDLTLLRQGQPVARC